MSEQKIDYGSSKARKHITLTKVNNEGRALSNKAVVKGTGVSLSAQYNPETLKFGKRVASKENNAAGEYSPPVELLGAQANTLSFQLRLNAYGEAPACPYPDTVNRLSDLYQFRGVSTITDAQELEKAYTHLDSMQQMYSQLIFLDSLQYPNPLKVAGKFFRTPLIKIQVGQHLPIVWVLDNITFNIKLFDPDLNVQRADVDVSFKMADCYYNDNVFEGTMKSPFYNLTHFVPLRQLTDEEVTSMTAGEKYSRISDLITED